MTRCPECSAVDQRAIASGLGGRWKMLCASCGHRYDWSDGDRVPVRPETVIDEGEVE